MHLVVDASLLVEVVRPEGALARAWLDLLLDGDDIHVVAGLTLLEVSSALRTLVRRHPDEIAWAESVHRALIELPIKQVPVGQPLLRRIWALRDNHTPYDAAYIALTEYLPSQLGSPVELATADGKMARSPVAQCHIRLYETG